MKTPKTNLLCLLLVLFGTLFFARCGKDNDTTPQLNLVGSWKEVRYEFIECPNEQDNLLDECGKNNNCETWQFNSDGTFKRTTTSGVSNSATYRIVGNKVSLCYPNCLDFTFTLVGPTLTLTEVITGSECVTRYTFSKN
jgi:hypothetical protein